MDADPIQYPVITLNDGQQLPIKFRCGDLIRLNKDHNLDLLSGNLPDLKGAAALSRTLLLLSAGIAHVMPISVEQLADMVDLSELPKVANAINESIKKASSQATVAAARPNEAPILQ